jgi:DNA-binding NarL/FixJ family response regulator
MIRMQKPTTVLDGDSHAGSRAPNSFEPPGWPSRGRQPPIRIALVDDHHIVREGLRVLLNETDGFVVVGEAATHDEAFELVATTRPDVLLVDLTYPDGDGMPLIRALRARHPDVRIVVLTMDRGSETVRQALFAGATGYVIKGARPRELFDAIRAVHRGERYLHSSVTGAVVDFSIRGQHTDGPLSMREREVIGLLAGGRPPSEVARILGISVHTVRRHIANASMKLDIHGWSQLTRYAVQHGIAR